VYEQDLHYGSYGFRPGRSAVPGSEYRPARARRGPEELRAALRERRQWSRKRVRSVARSRSLSRASPQSSLSTPSKEAALRTDQGDDLTAVDLEADALQRLDAAVGDLLFETVVVERSARLGLAREGRRRFGRTVSYAEQLSHRWNTSRHQLCDKSGRITWHVACDKRSRRIENIMNELRTLCFVAAAVLVAACSGSTQDDPNGVTAMNLDTGEIKSFDSESDVPSGWVTCSDAESCPAPHPCTEIQESSCLVREDCSPLYTDSQAFAGCSDLAETCEEVECGPAPGAPAFLCEDGTVGGNTGRCIRNDEGSCGWEMRDCPAIETCDESECGPMPGMPAIECDDGSIGGNTGRCILYGDMCGWEIRECPVGDCTTNGCGPNPYGMPNYQCADGEVGGPICSSESGTCGWSINDCEPLP